MKGTLGMFFRSERISLNEALQRITKRADDLSDNDQAQTFVSVGGLEHGLLNRDNRIIFGRRGTGKTHVLSYVRDKTREEGDFPVFIDARTIGSAGYVYSDGSISVDERASRLLRDFVNALHDKIFDAITSSQRKFDAENFSEDLELLASSVADIFVIEQVEEITNDETKKGISGSIKGSVKLTTTNPSANTTSELKANRDDRALLSRTLQGTSKLSIKIGTAARAINNISNKLPGRLWIFLDEWSNIPVDLQPILADFIKRCFFANQNVSVHIAAIEHRFAFRMEGNYGAIGIELGADAFADVNLDDFFVYENDPERAFKFFHELIWKHASNAAKNYKLDVNNKEDLLSKGFTQSPALSEIIKACEGVPRDFINIASIAATRAQDQKIGIPIVRNAAKDWYERDKAAFLQSNRNASKLLSWIINNVIANRKARAFLVPIERQDTLLERLFDERLLHIARRSYSSKDDPGIRYRVWKIDYGCYMEVVPTTRNPTGFLFAELEAEKGWDVVVPDDDFRAVRRAILELEEFYTQHGIIPE